MNEINLMATKGVFYSIATHISIIFRDLTYSSVREVFWDEDNYPPLNDHPLPVYVEIIWPFVLVDHQVDWPIIVSVKLYDL
jgi:hypothetical protein